MKMCTDMYVKRTAESQADKGYVRYVRNIL